MLKTVAFVPTPPSLTAQTSINAETYQPRTVQREIVQPDPFQQRTARHSSTTFSRWFSSNNFPARSNWMLTKSIRHWRCSSPLLAK